MTYSFHSAKSIKYSSTNTLFSLTSLSVLATWLAYSLFISVYFLLFDLRFLPVIDTPLSLLLRLACLAAE